MTGELQQARCKRCNARNCDHDGRGTIEWVCRRCNTFNSIRPRLTLPPLAVKGRVGTGSGER